MNEINIKIKKINPRVQLPGYQTEGSAGMDLNAFLDKDVAIPPFGRAKIPTGLQMEIPEGYEGQVRPRSGLALKHGITVLNSPGTIDSDYRGDVEIILINLGNESVIIKDGERIAQLIIAPITRVQAIEDCCLSDTARGDKGFGSTG